MKRKSKMSTKVAGMKEVPRGTLIAEFAHFHLFVGLPSYLRNLIGETGAINILVGAAREAMVRAIRESHLIKGTMVKRPFVEVFSTCYKLYEELGYPFEISTIEETEVKYVFKVTRCPHLPFTKKDPIACYSCFGIKQGVLHELLGYIPVINIRKRMAVGDPYCLFEVLKKERQRIPKI